MIERDPVVEILRQLGYEPEDRPIADLPWRIGVKYPGGEGRPQLNLTLISPPEGLDRCLVLAGIKANDGHRERIRQLSDAQYREFRFQLIRDLLTMNVHYRLEVNDETQDIVRVQVETRLWAEELDVPEMAAALKRVFDASLMAIAHIRNAAGVTP